MAQEEDQPVESGIATVASATSTSGARRKRMALIVLGAAGAALSAVWVLRKDIADDLIARQLDSMKLPARYEIVAIGPGEQVVRNLVIGDPRHPDLTVAELRVATRLRWGLPGIGRITLVRPRLSGRYRDGQLRFGSLDSVLAGGEGRFEMPDLDIAIEDGGAVLDGDLGRIGLSLSGRGELRGGFRGEIAAIAPRLAVGGCVLDHATAHGRLTTAAGRIAFRGPMRTDRLACPREQVTLSRAGVQVVARMDPALDGVEGSLGFQAGPAAQSANRAAGATGALRFVYRDRGFHAGYDLALRGVSTPHARVDALSFEGRARSADDFAGLEVEGDLRGRGVSAGAAIEALLADAEASGQGTLVAPLVAGVRRAWSREARNSTVAASLVVRRSREGYSLVIPQAALKGNSGARLLAVSRVQAIIGPSGPPRVTGNFTTGGQGLPALGGRMESDAAGRLAMRVSMPEYRAGTNSLAVPGLSLVQQPGGALQFSGQLRLSGELPGGRADGLILPLDGEWKASGELRAWRRCTRIAFDRLQFGSVVLSRQGLPACPLRDGAILVSREGGTGIALAVPKLDLAGRLGASSLQVRGGPVTYFQTSGSDGRARARALAIALGPAGAASQFSLGDLQATIGRDTVGTFTDADIALAAVPLDMRNGAGDWRLRDGGISLDRARFTLVDRERVARFNPLVARDATLRLADGAMVAEATLREPSSDREVVRATVVHELGSGAGHADLAVVSLRFDDKVQADTLSSLALGIVSNLAGVVRGTGRIRWSGNGVTSHGRLAADSLAFAAPFGPVKGVSGEIVLTDLLGLVTAPDQKLSIASINPGIEVTDGSLSFEMKPGHLLVVNGASWPFMGGTLTLDPARMQIGIAETRAYTLRVSGLDASTFVNHLQLSNLGATGVFDGELPLIFDENGGRIDAGHLVSRPPGGNVAYVGELTYKDLSPMGNFAFQTLKSVDYQRMEISLDGTLAGEIITRVSFNGVSQGVGARRNFITRQVARLPIRFILNVKAPFFSLFAPLRSLYDPAYVTDPRTLGFLRNGRVPGIAVSPDKGQGAIQPPVSENHP